MPLHSIEGAEMVESGEDGIERLLPELKRSVMIDFQEAKAVEQAVTALIIQTSSRRGSAYKHPSVLPTKTVSS